MAEEYSQNEPLVASLGAALGLSTRASGGIARQLAQQALTSLSTDRRWLVVACREHYAIVSLDPERGPFLHAHRTLVTVSGTQEAVTAACLLTFTDESEDGPPATALLLGSSRGYLHMADTECQPLMRERLAEGACCSIAADSRTDNGEAGVTLAFANAVARADIEEVRSLFHSGCQQARLGGLAPGSLRCTKWELPKAIGARSFACCAGHVSPSLYDCLAGRSPPPRLLLLTAGRAPAIACFEAAEAAAPGVLGLVAELASGVGGVARTLVRGRPDGIRAGLGSWLGRLGSNTASAVTEGPEIPPSPKARPGPSASLGASFDDEPREVTAFLPAPGGALAVAADSLGRVLLLDTAAVAVLRVWKAYRSAQLAWLALPQAEGEANGRLLLALYSPKRGLLELWQPRLGPRLCSWPRGRAGRLLAPAGGAAEPRPLFLDCESGVIEDVAALAAAELRA